MIPAIEPAGKPVTRKPRSRAAVWLMRIGAFLLAVPLGLAALGAAYQALATAVEQRSHPAPGQMIDVGGYRLHLYCQGQGSPAVVLDGANQAEVSNWAWIQPELAQGTRVCAYDRPGWGWSDPSPGPQDTVQNARTLHLLLERAGVAPPYVLAGHSFGGLYTRMFAELYPAEVAGMVFIEGTPPDANRAQGQPDVMPNAPSASMIDAAPLIGRLGLLRLMNFPPTDPDLPEPQRSALAAHLAASRWADQIKRQYHLYPTLLAQIRPLYTAGSLGNRPVAVVLGTEGAGGEDALRDLFEQQGALSSRGKIYWVEGANHISLVDRQEHAAQTRRAIEDVIEAARGR